MKPRKGSTLTIRITDELKQRIEAASASMPYKPSITSIAERGFELALAELEKIATQIAESADK